MKFIKVGGHTEEIVNIDHISQIVKDPSSDDGGEIVIESAGRIDFKKGYSALIKELGKSIVAEVE
jgi:hypothetical protein